MRLPSGKKRLQPGASVCYAEPVLSARDPLRRRAAEMLTLATLFWGISFPVMKTIGLRHQDLLAAQDTWFAASSMVMVRFGVAALITLAWTWRTLRQITGLELWEGFGLGVCAGLGMVFQVDGLVYTSASASAFLTQCTCLVLPWVVAVRDRRWPSWIIVFCSVIASGGVAILANVDWQHFRLGRGELETLISSFIFTAQILWLDRPLFARNRVRHFTLAMFVTMTVITLPIAILTTRAPRDWVVAYTSPVVLFLIALLIVFCTMIAFVVMNRWQPAVPAAEAGLIYASEPVFASVFALFLPAWLSRLAGIDYPNEKLTASLLLGGGLITAANVLVQWSSARRPAPTAKAAGMPEAPQPRENRIGCASR